MKLLALIAGCLAASSALGQGTVNFSNFGLEVNAPFFDENGVLLQGTNFLAQLYAGETAEPLVSVGTPTPFLSGAGAGNFFGGSVGPPFTSYGGPVWVQVRAWYATGG